MALSEAIDSTLIETTRHEIERKISVISQMKVKDDESRRQVSESVRMALKQATPDVVMCKMFPHSLIHNKRERHVAVDTRNRNEGSIVALNAEGELVLLRKTKKPITTVSAGNYTNLIPIPHEEYYQYGVRALQALAALVAPPQVTRR